MALSAVGADRLLVAMLRDRIAVMSALTGVTAVAWFYLWRLAGDMDPSAPMAMMEIRRWAPVDFGLTALM